MPRGRKKRLSKRNFRSKIFNQIYHDFIWPLRRYKSKEQTYYNWLREIFCVETRSIVKYRARESFALPGKLFVAGSIPIEGLGYRKVRKGATLYVRHDTTMPDRFDVETDCAPRRKTQVFFLTDYEWTKVKRKLMKRSFRRGTSRTRH